MKAHKRHDVGRKLFNVYLSINIFINANIKHCYTGHGSHIFFGTILSKDSIHLPKDE